MLKSIKKTLLGAALVAGVSAPHAFAETTLNALFMAQAAYSEADVRAMTDAFTKANPDIKVNLEFVPYEGLHDKTVLAQGSGSGYDVVLFDVIWPAEYAANNVLVDVSSRITDEMKKGVLPGAWTTVARPRIPWALSHDRGPGRSPPWPPRAARPPAPSPQGREAGSGGCSCHRM